MSKRGKAHARRRAIREITARLLGAPTPSSTFWRGNAWANNAPIQWSQIPEDLIHHFDYSAVEYSPYMPSMLSNTIPKPVNPNPKIFLVDPTISLDTYTSSGYPEYVSSSRDKRAGGKQRK